MTADDREPQGILEANVSRLFERLKEPDLRAETTRRRILDRLLQETSLPRRTRTGAIARRWMRWAGLAAALVVIAGLLTIDRDRPAKTGNGNPVVSFAIHLLATGPGPGVVEASSAQGGEPLRIHPERQVSNVDVQSARAVRAGSGCRVDIHLTNEGAGKLARLTRNHIGERLAVVIDGRVVMTPMIRSEIVRGEVALTGDFTNARCEQIARGLSARN
ncbi:MAG TPA: hypothetical protein VMX54_15450 [Vicinamibacteria bacterium]|nr:hypothetical protein [Vicinamibacteria bacterium]